MVTLIILLIVIFYIIPFLACYIWINKAFSKRGIYKFREPDENEFWQTIVPIVNIGAAFSFWENSPMMKKNPTERENVEWVIKFFGIKK